MTSEPRAVFPPTFGMKNTSSVIDVIVSGSVTLILAIVTSYAMLAPGSGIWASWSVLKTLNVGSSPRTKRPASAEPATEVPSSSTAITATLLVNSSPSASGPTSVVSIVNSQESDWSGSSTSPTKFEQVVDVTGPPTVK